MKIRPPNAQTRRHQEPTRRRAPATVGQAVYVAVRRWMERETRDLPKGWFNAPSK